MRCEVSNGQRKHQSFAFVASFTKAQSCAYKAKASITANPATTLLYNYNNQQDHETPLDTLSRWMLRPSCSRPVADPSVRAICNQQHTIETHLGRRHSVVQSQVRMLSSPLSLARLDMLHDPTNILPHQHDHFPQPGVRVFY